MAQQVRIKPMHLPVFHSSWKSNKAQQARNLPLRLPTQVMSSKSLLPTAKSRKSGNATKSIGNVMKRSKSAKMLKSVKPMELRNVAAMYRELPRCGSLEHQ